MIIVSEQYNNKTCRDMVSNMGALCVGNTIKSMATRAAIAECSLFRFGIRMYGPKFGSDQGETMAAGSFDLKH